MTANTGKTRKLTTQKLTQELTERKAKSLVNNPKYDQSALQTKSMYHQFVDLQPNREIIKRYTKTDMSMLQFFRQNPVDTSDRIEGLLKTDDEFVKPEWFPYNPLDTSLSPPNEVSPVNLWEYKNDVIELYSGVDDIRTFEHFNRKLIEDGKLVEYKEGTNYAYNNMYGELDTTGDLGAPQKFVAKVRR